MSIFTIILLNLVFCCCVFSYCTLYNHGSMAELSLEIKQYNISKCIINSIVIKKQNYFNYMNGNKVTIYCKRTVVNWKDNSGIKLQWKIQQFNHDLLVTETTELDYYKLEFTLDSYDHDLIVRCSSNENSQYNTTFVQFKFNDIQEINKEHFDYPEIHNITEGQSVLNNFRNPVIHFKKSNYTSQNKVIEPNKNILNKTTLDDNGTVYSVWTRNHLQRNLRGLIHIKKLNYVIIVNPSEQNDTETRFPTTIVALGVIGLIFILLALICAYYKYFKRRETSDDTYEHIYTEPQQVVYAQIDLKDSENPAPTQTDEPYAEIIGKLMPKQNRRRFQEPGQE